MLSVENSPARDRRNICCRTCKRPFRYLFQKALDHGYQLPSFESSQKMKRDYQVNLETHEKGGTCYGRTAGKRRKFDTRETKITEVKQEQMAGETRDVLMKQKVPEKSNPSEKSPQREGFMTLSNTLLLKDVSFSEPQPPNSESLKPVNREGSHDDSMKTSKTEQSDQHIEDLSYWCLSKCMVRCIAVY